LFFFFESRLSLYFLHYCTLRTILRNDNSDNNDVMDHIFVLNTVSFLPLSSEWLKSIPSVPVPYICSSDLAGGAYSAPQTA